MTAAGAEAEGGWGGPAGRLDPARAEAFILANTAAFRPPHVPEIELRLADEAHHLWLRTQEELDAFGLPPPFWAFAWAGGQALARHILDEPRLVRGRRVLDFASGSGLVAIAAARAGAASVRAADIDPFCEAAIGLNAALNGVALAYEGGDLVGSPVEEEVVLAGDIFFDREIAGRIVPWFEALAAAGRTVLVGDPGRAYLPRERLACLSTFEVPVNRTLEDIEVKRASVFLWKPPCGG